MRQAQHLLAEQLEDVELDRLGCLGQVRAHRLCVAQAVDVVHGHVRRDLSAVGREDSQRSPVRGELLHRAACACQRVRDSGRNRCDEREDVKRLPDILRLVVLSLQRFNGRRVGHISFPSRSDWLVGGTLSDFHAEAHHLNDAISGAHPQARRHRSLIHPPRSPHHRTN